MVFHHGSRKGTNTLGLSRWSQHVCVLVPKCRCVLRSFLFLLPVCPGSTHYMSSRLLPSVLGSPSFLAELWEDLPDASLWGLGFERGNHRGDGPSQEHALSLETLT